MIVPPVKKITMTKHKEHPILMKPFLIEAILNTQLNTWPPQPIDENKAFKGMTRRVIKPASKNAAGFIMAADYRGNNVPYEIDEHERMFENSLKCPYGQPGDLIWVKETWGYAFKNEFFQHGKITVPDHPDYCFYFKTDSYFKESKRIRWKSPRFMPKSAARIWLQIVDIKPERLQDITELQAVREGVEFKRIEDDHCELSSRGTHVRFKNYYKPLDKKVDGWPTAFHSFQSLWEQINGTGNWKTNPWVWVISFKVLSVTGRPDPSLICPP